MITSLIIFIISCNSTNQNQYTNFDLGFIKKNKYHNNFFGMEVSLPSDWTVNKQEDIKLIEEYSQDMMFDDNDLKKVIKSNKVRSANILSISEYELGTPVEFNPNINIIAENLKGLPGIKSGKDYLINSKKVLSQSNLKFTIMSDDYKSYNIGGRTFFNMDLEAELMGVSYKQSFYATVYNGFALLIVATYGDYNQKIQLSKIIKNISFNS